MGDRLANGEEDEADVGGRWRLEVLVVDIPS